MQSDVLSAYFQDLKNLECLSREEEVELAKRIKKGDKAAENKLITSNLRFVVRVAKNYVNQGVLLEDLISIGNIGLMKAVKKFDENKNIKFISYAVWWIRQIILVSLSKQSRLMRIPVNVIADVVEYRKAKEEFYQEKKREATIQELAEILAIDEKEVLTYYEIDSRFLSLDSQVFDDVSLGETIQSEDITDSLIDEQSTKNAINALLKTLPHKQCLILQYYFGINDDQCSYSLQEIGDKLKMTRERVRQIKANGLSALRHKKLLKNLKF